MKFPHVDPSAVIATDADGVRFVTPSSITRARYNGAYEGAPWVAFALDGWDVPGEAFADDTTASGFWWDGPGLGGPDEGETRETRYVGRGESPAEASADLVRRLEQVLKHSEEADTITFSS